MEGTYKTKFHHISFRQSKISVVHLKSGGVKTESMQIPDGLQLDDPEIYRSVCIPGGLWNQSGLRLESNRNVWRCKVHSRFVKLHLGNIQNPESLHRPLADDPIVIQVRKIPSKPPCFCQTPGHRKA